MGLFSFVKKQFIDIIQWTESEPGVLVYRYGRQLSVAFKEAATPAQVIERNINNYDSKNQSIIWTKPAEKVAIAPRRGVVRANAPVVP